MNEELFDLTDRVAGVAGGSMGRQEITITLQK
jgi:hypothetical protein